MIERVGPWKCFHCDEVFVEFQAALKHFGHSEMKQPACQIDAAKLRELEGELWKYREEDTDLHRQMHVMAGNHQTELRRAEELGYSRGLRDAHLVEA